MNLGRHRRQRNWGTRVHEIALFGLDAIVLENELLCVTVLAGKGTDVVEFNFKPRDLDFVTLTPGGIRNPLAALPSTSDPLASFLDVYPGGWQEILPNAGAPSTAYGAHFDQHAEVSAVPWDVALVEDTEAAVCVRFSVRLQKLPLVLVKELRLNAGEATLHVSETLTNECDLPVQVMWGQHIAFGKPFLVPGATIRLPGRVEIIPHPEAIAPGGRRVSDRRGAIWPMARGASLKSLDLSVVPAPGAPSDIVYLTGFTDGWYEITRPTDGTGLRVEWDTGTFPCLWYWQEFGATTGYPWYGRAWMVGLEPMSSYPTNGLAEAIANGTALSLAPRASRQTWYRVEVRNDEGGA